MNKIKNRLSGFWDSLSFSNWPAILSQRLFFSADRITAYLWKKKWWLVCDRNYLDDHSPKEVLARGVYNEGIKASFSGTPFRYVNVGANVGAFDVAVASLIEEIERGVCFELNPRTADRLRFNLSLNRMDYLDVLNVGISDVVGEVVIKETGCAHNFSIFNSDQIAVGDEVKCELRQLSEALAEISPASGEWDLLKLDCEGAEYGILKREGERLRQFAHILLEIHEPPEGYQRSDISLFLAQVGFQRIMPAQNHEEAAIEFYRRI